MAGTVVLVSGLLRDQRRTVLAELTGLGLRYLGQRAKAEWVALHLQGVRP